MYRLKKVIFDSYDLEFYYPGDNPPRVVPVFEFIDDDELYLFASTARRNWDDYHEHGESQPLFYVSDNDIQEIEPFDISAPPIIIDPHGKTPSNKGSS